MGRMRALPVIALIVAACAPRPDADGDAGGVVADACGASRYVASIGQPLAAVQLPRGENARVITPGSVVTTDFLPTRLNFYISDTGLIERVACG